MWNRTTLKRREEKRREEKRREEKRLTAAFFGVQLKMRIKKITVMDGRRNEQG